jgi:hypothetical protein
MLLKAPLASYKSVECHRMCTIALKVSTHFSFSHACYMLCLLSFNFVTLIIFIKIKIKTALYYKCTFSLQLLPLSYYQICTI